MSQSRSFPIAIDLRKLKGNSCDLTAFDRFTAFEKTCCTVFLKLGSAQASTQRSAPHARILPVVSNPFLSSVWQT